MSSIENPAASQYLKPIWDILKTIPDPEIPVVSVVEMGMVRGVGYNAASDETEITITPTYSGCPAMAVIKENIRTALAGHGVHQIKITTKLAPAWTTDWLSTDTKQKLRDYGISPPPNSDSAAHAAIACPQCGSEATEMISRVAASPCQALYRCRACLEPFPHFKCH
ncbi:MAG: phenylacetate-CoA oxygenase subunit PaaJ [Candidatus Symbiobacter sp.]|nr:phenylacetate-CoA oxygenase subunit PaaJ [Candidatus Symbiobacter sp.]